MQTNAITTNPVACVDLWHNDDHCYSAAITLAKTASNQQIEHLRDGLRQAEFTIPMPPKGLPYFEVTHASLAVANIRDPRLLLQVLEKLGMKPEKQYVY